MSVGENIRKLRKEKGLTQKQLGELCGMKEANIRKYELNKANPKIETIKRIASALNVNALDITGIQYFDLITDLDELKKELSEVEQFEKLFISLYGKDEYTSFQQYCLLTKEGAEKVKIYIHDLLSNPAYKTNL